MLRISSERHGAVRQTASPALIICALRPWFSLGLAFAVSLSDLGTLVRWESFPVPLPVVHFSFPSLTFS